MAQGNAQCRGWAWSPLWLTEPAKVKNFTDEPPSSEKRWEMQLFGIEWTQSYQSRARIHSFKRLWCRVLCRSFGYSCFRVPSPNWYKLASARKEHSRGAHKPAESVQSFCECRSWHVLLARAMVKRKRPINDGDGSMVWFRKTKESEGWELGLSSQFDE